MGAPCINDTCSITSLIDPVTRRLEHHVKIDPLGGLKACETTGDTGVGVLIYGDPANVAPSHPGFNELGISLAGELYSVPNDAILASSFGGAVVPIDHASSHSSPSVFPITSGGVIVNPYSETALLIVSGTYQIGYTLEANFAPDFTVQTGDAGPPYNFDFLPYEGQLGAQVLINSVEKSTAYFDIGGMADNDNMPQHRRRWQDFYFAMTILGGASIPISAHAWVQGAEGGNPAGTLLNIDVETPVATAPAFPDRGFQVSGRAFILPMGVS